MFFASLFVFVVFVNQKEICCVWYQFCRLRNLKKKKLLSVKEKGNGIQQKHFRLCDLNSVKEKKIQFHAVLATENCNFQSDPVRFFFLFDIP